MAVTVTFNFPATSRRAQPQRFLTRSDGDTLATEQPIRLVSCDTPEKAGYAGKPETAQPKLNRCRERLQDGSYQALPAGLRSYLIKKLTPDAAEKHINAAIDASAALDTIIEERLTLANGDRRKVAVKPTGELIDTYGRLLAYVGPWFSGSAADPIPPKGDPARNTFNLDMVERGWAAFFPIYPSLPSNVDMNLAIAAAESAWTTKAGPWKKYGRNLLLGYEYRMCIKLGTAATPEEGIVAAFQRICIDLRTMRKAGKFFFHRVPVPYRLWVWEKDEAEATQALGLTT